MPLSRDEAAEALRDVERTQRQSFSAYSYRAAAPFFLLWGVLWVVGYGGTEFGPHLAGWCWLFVTVIGVAASTLLGMRAKPGKARFDSRFAVTWLASMGFLASIFSVIGHITGDQVGAIIPLLIAWSYVVMGAWMGWRLILAGVAVAVLTLAGFFHWHEHFAGWMAVVGGVTLIGTGLWLRSA
jgi:hypothetical protein